jgi:hypothetical protein
VFCFLLHLPSGCCFLQGSSPMNELRTIHPLILKRNREVQNQNIVYLNHMYIYSCGLAMK